MSAFANGAQQFDIEGEISIANPKDVVVKSPRRLILKFHVDLDLASEKKRDGDPEPWVRAHCRSIYVREELNDRPSPYFDDRPIRSPTEGAGQPDAAAELLLLDAAVRVRFGKDLVRLREQLRHPCVNISADRRWQPEFRENVRLPLSWRLAPNGGDLKYRCYRANTAKDWEQKRLFQELKHLLGEDSAPFPIKEVVPVEDEFGLDLYQSYTPLSDRGSGPQQWAMVVGMVVMSQASIVGLEEPEMNLSWSAQRSLATKLIDLVKRDQFPHQLFVTSHSPVMYEVNNAAGGERGQP